MFFALFPLAFAALLSGLQKSNGGGTDEYYSLVGWIYTCMLVYLMAHWIIGLGISKFGEPTALTCLSAIVLGLLFYWQSGGREQFGWLLPGGSNTQFGPGVFLVPLFARFVNKRKSTEQKMPVSIADDPSAQPPANK